MSQDEEYARMVVEAQARSGKTARYSPPMQNWTQESAMLAVLADKLTVLNMTLISANGGNAGSFVPYPRPKTAIDKVQAERRQSKHDRITRMLLPHLYPEE